MAKNDKKKKAKSDKAREAGKAGGKAQAKAKASAKGKAKAAKAAPAAKQVLVSPLAPAAFPDMPVIAGVEFASGAAGIKYQGRTDVMLVRLAPMDPMAHALMGRAFQMQHSAPPAEHHRVRAHRRRHRNYRRSGDRQRFRR